MRSVLIIGAGRFGGNLAEKLVDLKNEVMLVDRNEEVINRLAPKVTRAQIGDCMDKDVLAALGVRNFDICFVCISDNFQSSMEITSLLKELGASYVVPKCDGDLHAELLLKIGADEVVYPERDMAWRTAARFSAKGAFDYIELSPEYALIEIAPPASWVGHSLKELNVRSQYGFNVIGVRVNGKVIPLTSAEHIFREDGHVLITGSQDQIHRVMDK